MIFIITVNTSVNHTNMNSEQLVFHDNENDHSTTEIPITLPNTDNNHIFSPIIYVYKTEDNMGNEEFETGFEIPSVFDLTSYNNTCGRNAEERACYIQQNTTAHMEAELCRRYVHIIGLAYEFSCYYDTPGDRLINASTEYIQYLSVSLLTQEIYLQSMHDVQKMAQVVQMSDIQALQGVKAFSLPHSPSHSFTIVPKEIPTTYQDQHVYVVELDKYLQMTVNVSNYITENNLTNIFPYLNEILIDLIDKTGSMFYDDVQTLGKLSVYYNLYNEFLRGYRTYDIIVIGSAGIIFIIGIVLNILLIAVFTKFREMRTYHNVLLINLTVVDCISLVFNLLVYYSLDRIFSVQVDCTTLTILILIRHVSYIVSVYSVVIISFQRYNAISQPFCKLSLKTITILSTCGVWIFGVLYSLPHIVFVNYSEGLCIYEPGKYIILLLNLQLFILCILPLILVAVFSIMASYKLRKSVKMIPGERIGLEMRIQQRIISSRILLGLIFLSTISYIPHHIVSYIYTYVSPMDEISLDSTPVASQYIKDISFNLLHLNSCFNPLILCLLSKKFRKCFHKIICFCKSPDK